MEQDGDDPWEEERSWRDPSAHNVRQVVAIWNNSEKIHLPEVPFFFSEVSIIDVSNIDHQESTTSERLDVQSYEHQLLSTLAECSSLVEKHNRDIVSHFLSL